MNGELKNLAFTDQELWWLHQIGRILYGMFSVDDNYFSDQGIICDLMDSLEDIDPTFLQQLSNVDQLLDEGFMYENKVLDEDGG